MLDNPQLRGMLGRQEYEERLLLAARDRLIAQAEGDRSGRGTAAAGAVLRRILAAALQRPPQTHSAPSAR